jgi:hypothetical protein
MRYGNSRANSVTAENPYGPGFENQDGGGLLGRLLTAVPAASPHDLGN